MKKMYLLPLLLAMLPAAYAAGNSAFDPLGVWKVFGFGAAILAIFSMIAVCFGSHMSEARKKFLFVFTAFCVIAVTAYFIITTVALNLSSSTKGPIHWHADFEIYKCGQRLELADPKGMSNRVGSSVFHGHNDDRIHVEGPVLLPEHVNVQEFIEVIGGKMTSDALGIPTDGGMVEMANGQQCNGLPSELQVFLMKVENPGDQGEWRYTQTKLYSFIGYVLSPYAQVPPGDCIIIEFGPTKEKTEHLCETFELAKKRGELSGG